MASPEKTEKAYRQVAGAHKALMNIDARSVPKDLRDDVQHLRAIAGQVESQMLKLVQASPPE